MAKAYNIDQKRKLRPEVGPVLSNLVYGEREGLAILHRQIASAGWCVQTRPEQQ